MLATLRQRNFALLWTGGLISLLGDWALAVGLPLFVYALTGSTVATGAMVIARLIPRVLLSSVAGVFVDRWDRKRTMVCTDLLLALFLLPLLAVRDADRLWIVFLAQLAESSLVQLFRPAERALLPRLVGEEYLIPANSLTAMNNNLARLIGPSIGGFLFAVLGLNGVVVIDAASFLIAATMIAAISTQARPDRAARIGATTPRKAWVAVWREWLDGLRLVPSSRLIVALFLFGAITGFGENVMSTLFVPFVTKILGGDGLAYGWILSAQAVGGLAGSLVVGHLSGRITPPRLLGFSAVLFGLTDLAIFYYPLFVPGFVLALLLMVIAGILSAGMIVSYLTMQQTAVADAYRGRLFGAFETTEALVGLFGAGLAGLLSARLGIVPIISIQGFGYLGAGIMVLVMLRRTLGANGAARSAVTETAGVSSR
ncbi:MAG: MFS transporter [Thermomicrobiales bacterium]